MGKILETGRLLLRTWTYADAEKLYEICRDPQVMYHIGDGKPFASIEHAHQFLNWAVSYQKKNGFCRWAVIEKTGQTIVGSCGFARLPAGDIELGYLFAQEFWGKGFATEAARGCLGYGFKNLGFEKIVALTDLDHAASQKVLEKIGFTRRGIVRGKNDENDMLFEMLNPYKTSR